MLIQARLYTEDNWEENVQKLKTDWLPPVLSALSVCRHCTGSVVCGVWPRPATNPMVTSKYKEVCDDTDLVTNLVTKAKRPHEVGVCYKPRRLGYWLRGQDGYECTHLMHTLSVHELHSK